jgi:hypothetical protein
MLAEAQQRLPPSGSEPLLANACSSSAKAAPKWERAPARECLLKLSKGCPQVGASPRSRMVAIATTPIRPQGQPPTGEKAPQECRCCPQVGASPCSRMLAQAQQRLFPSGSEPLLANGRHSHNTHSAAGAASHGGEAHSAAGAASHGGEAHSAAGAASHRGEAHSAAGAASHRGEAHSAAGAASHMEKPPTG